MQLLDRGGPHPTIDREPGIALELFHGGLRGVAEDAVLVARVEPELVQASLQIHDVVTTERDARPHEQAVTQRVTGLDERPPRLRADQPIGRQATDTLKLADRLLGACLEDAIDEQIRDVQPRKTLLDVCDVSSGRAASKR
jgi:hypothetical protein